ncbi:AraC family transcriptional regulator [Promicromonospora citrea]|uniref:AraC family transcriptional regulator n=1 Tax=Promicromonospora citrea TaxID=43677 RepID=A0A8H9GQA3_9MICO|nr:AraC family transcriptional regulator [Promicromonospora citrea]NNH52162.1 AraC family transcriptional regulator [Promicromonospora citrea]GGM37413.1 AraC family transcriptional regulator [Promicromonospora citrea]
MDLVGEVIRSVRVGRPGARLVRQTGPRGVRFPAFEGSGFHIVLAGTCWLVSEHAGPVELRPGDVVLASAGAAHGLSPVPARLGDLPMVAFGPHPPEQGPARFEFLCGSYHLAHGAAPHYLRTLPALVVVSPDRERAPRLRALADLLRAEVAASPAGDDATVPALLDLVLVHVLRQWREEHEPGDGALTDDPAIATALREIHERPAEPWTVERLSRVAGLPRTSFARRFTELVGRPPMRYLTEWRLDRAAGLLRETDAPLATIARQVGYATEFAFSAAFRRAHGVPPGRFRRVPSPGMSGDDAPGRAGTVRAERG